MDQNDLNEAVKTTKREEIDAFHQRSYTRKQSMFLGSNMHVRMQTLEEEEDGNCFPPSLSIMNTYTEMSMGNE